MSAEVLRAAARLMRERASGVVSGGQWTGSHYWVEDYDPSDPSGQTSMQRLIGGMDAPDCDHYSSWHPAVALAVAAWLDEESWREETPIGDGITLGGPSLTALAVARAYLGSDQ